MASSALAAVNHIVVLMLENRSFDHMLGWLYAEAGNLSPAGDRFEGLTGAEACPGPDGSPVAVSRIRPDTPHGYFLPGANPGEGYPATTTQLYGCPAAPAGDAVAPMSGFVTDYAAAIADDQANGCYVVPGTSPSWIMGCHTPDSLPVLSALARGFAVCDHWYACVPTQTMPNRAFACAGTSQGHLDDTTKKFTVPSIFGALSTAAVPWKIYGYTSPALTKLNFPDTAAASSEHFGQFTDFQADAAAGALPGYAFLEPCWSTTGNSQHPNHNVALGEQLLLDTYRALRAGPGWASTLLIITYDEHGGCYDHVPPPWGAAPPDASLGEDGFAFTRYGVRVPTILVSPLIPAGRVHRVPGRTTPFDHTSILATVEHRFHLAPLTARDAAAPDLAAVLTLPHPRRDDPLATVTAPPAPAIPTSLAAQPAHLQRIHAELLAAQRGPHALPPTGLRSNADYRTFITAHPDQTDSPATVTGAGSCN